MTENQKRADRPSSRMDDAANRAAPADDAGEAQMQAQFDKEAEQGYRGYHVDPTPNSAYTVAGVTSGEPTPETDDEAFAKTLERRREADRMGGAR